MASTMSGNFGESSPHQLSQTSSTGRHIDRAYNVVFGLFQAPYYAFSQTMMAEVSPPGFDNMVKSMIRWSMPGV